MNTQSNNLKRRGTLSRASILKDFSRTTTSFAKKVIGLENSEIASALQTADEEDSCDSSSSDYIPDEPIEQN